MFHGRFRSSVLLAAISGITIAGPTARSATLSLGGNGDSTKANAGGTWNTANAWSNAGTPVTWTDSNDAVIGSASAIGGATWSLSLYGPGALAISAGSVAINLPAGDRFTLGATATNKGASLSTTAGLTLTSTGGGVSLRSFLLKGAGGLTIDVGTGTAQVPASSAQNNFTYTGVTTIKSGTYLTQSIGNGGVASDLGASNTAAGNLVIDGGTLQVGNATTATNRLFTVGTGGATIDAIGTTVVNFSNTGNVAYTGTGPHSLTLSASNGVTDTFSPVIADGTDGGRTSLTKKGGGTWQLNGQNTYTGSTSVSGGKLILGTTGSLKFNIGSFSGSNNAITGAGIGQFDGTFNFDLINASTDHAATWTLVNLTGGTTYGATFSVAGFTQSGTVWSNGTFSFDQATGVLSIPEPGAPAALSVMTIGAVSRRRRAL